MVASGPLTSGRSRQRLCVLGIQSMLLGSVLSQSLRRTKWEPASCSKNRKAIYTILIFSHVVFAALSKRCLPVRGWVRTMCKWSDCEERLWVAVPPTDCTGCWLIRWGTFWLLFSGNTHSRPLRTLFPLPDRNRKYEREVCLWPSRCILYTRSSLK